MLRVHLHVTVRHQTVEHSAVQHILKTQVIALYLYLHLLLCQCLILSDQCRVRHILFITVCPTSSTIGTKLVGRSRSIEKLLPP